MIAFPNAKINLGLNIIAKRTDGYHELETCFYPVPWQDALEIIEAKKKTSISVSGIEVPGDSDNIILKAYELLHEAFRLPPVQIHLHKVIPIGAGLGGGSADAAFTLKLLNELFRLELDDKTLMKFAVQLGADCAFFINNKPMLATGIGEQLSELEISLKDKCILLAYPSIHVSTKEAFSTIVPSTPERSIAQVLKEKHITEWEGNLTNDFEKSLFRKYPILKDIKNKMYDFGALYASMSGSGSCMYGIFDTPPKVDFPNTYKLFAGRL